MTDYSVIDVVSIHTLEVGDTISDPNYPLIITDIQDYGDDIFLTCENKYGDAEQINLPAFGMIQLLAIIDEEVFI